jgi:parallel beta-helix repeat protein
MNNTRFSGLGRLVLAALSSAPLMGSAEPGVFPAPDEQQLPRRMHAPMTTRPAVRVGQSSADLVGTDNRALQAAVDYLAGLGGGTVEIGPGEYRMRDSLHLRSHVTVRGTPGQTVLKKAPAAVSVLALDGDYGEEQVTVGDPTGFAVGDGVAVWDKNANGFHTTVGRITGQRGNTFAISKPLNADCMVAGGAQAATVFPVVSGYDLEEARVEDLIIDGNQQENVALNGCRGAGLFLYRGFGTVIERCTVRNYHGDGISFQQSNDVQVRDCVSEDNAGLGLHPGSGSQRPLVRNCVARRNGEDGLFLCWRVRHGVFEDNVLEGNGRHGISIGHKDTDNLLRHNRVIGNRAEGVMFRDEALGMAAHRNRLEENTIEDNGGAGIRIRGATQGIVLKGNSIGDTRAADARTQKTGIVIEKHVGPVTLEANRIESGTPLDDQRPAQAAK